MRRAFFGAAAMIVAIAAAGCSDSKPTTKDAITVKTPDGKAKLTIPAGALPIGTTADDVKLERIPADNYESFTNIKHVASFRLLPDGLVLSSPAQLRIEVDAATAKDQTLTALHIGKDSVEVPQLTVDKTEVRASVPHFSEYVYFIGDTAINTDRTGFVSDPPASTHIHDAVQVDGRLNINRDVVGWRYKRSQDDGVIEVVIRWDKNAYTINNLRILTTPGLFEPAEVVLEGLPATESADQVLLPASFVCSKAGFGGLTLNAEVTVAKLMRKERLDGTIAARVKYDFRQRYGYTATVDCLANGADAGPDASGRTDGAVADGGPGDGAPSGDGGGSGASWSTIQPGTFTAGSPATESCRSPNETQYQVTLTRAFEIQKTETTRDEFKALRGYVPSALLACSGGTCPVVDISWSEATAYCNALSAQAGLAQCYSCTGGGTTISCQPAPAYTQGNIYNCPGYRLPTEGEWEYAYRAGTTSAYYSGAAAGNCDCNVAQLAHVDGIAWNTCNGGNVAHPVGQKTPNAWGLFDMAGNAAEWCHDVALSDPGSVTPSTTDPWGVLPSNPGAQPGYVFRNGAASAAGDRWSVRAAKRGSRSNGKATEHIGFRCARTLAFP